MIILVLVFTVFSQSEAAQTFSYPDGNVQIVFATFELPKNIMASGVLNGDTLNAYFIYQNIWSGSMEAMIFLEYVSFSPKNRTVTYKISGTQDGRTWIDLGVEVIQY